MKKDLILKFKVSFWELTDLVHCVSLIGKTSDKFFNSTKDKIITERHNYPLYENVSDKLAETEDALYELIEKKRKGIVMTLQGVFLLDEAVFKTMFGKELIGKNTEAFTFIDKFIAYASNIDYLYEEKEENFLEEVRRIKEKVFTEIIEESND